MELQKRGYDPDSGKRVTFDCAERFAGETHHICQAFWITKLSSCSIGDRVSTVALEDPDLDKLQPP